MVRLYQGRGREIKKLDFEGEEEPIHTILADNEFSALKESVEEWGIDVQIVSKQEHVPEVERQNRVIKERARGIIQTLPYGKLPKKIRVAMIHYVVFWLNNLSKEGEDYSPRDIIMGHQILNYASLCKLPFGAYVQVHEDNQITNNMESRTTGGINFGPSNLYDAHKFYSLRTGEIITRRKWTELPIPSKVIEKIDELASDPKDLVIEYLTQEENEDKEGEEDVSERNENVRDEKETKYNNLQKESNQEMIRESTLEQDELKDLGTNSNEKENSEEEYEYPRIVSLYSVLSVPTSTKKWGQRATKAIEDELKALLTEEVFQELKQPAIEQKRKALFIHCFVVEKRDGRIKARAVADGRTQ